MEQTKHTPLMIVQAKMGKQGGTIQQAIETFAAMPWHERSDLIAEMIRTCPRAETLSEFIKAHHDQKERDTVEKRNKIVNYCASVYGLKLTPADGPHDATDEKGRRVVIVGQWIHGIGYTINGIVRERTKGKPFYWLGNGQASTGAVQLAHPAECDHVPFNWPTT
jgi:hypothetical protein